MRMIVRSILLLTVVATTAAAQTPAHDPSDHLREVLPPEIREQVLARIAEARMRELPAQALEHRALELAAKGATPADLVRRIDAHADALARGKAALEHGRADAPTPEEVKAAGEVIVRGVDGGAVSALASSASSGRSLVVPLHVLSELMSHGVAANEAVARMQARLDARSTDDEMRSDVAGGTTPWGEAARPPVTGRALGEMLRPGTAGPPPGVPANPGVSGSVPTPGQKPPTPPVQPPVGPPPA